jgi:hypothetical protein
MGLRISPEAHDLLTVPWKVAALKVVHTLAQTTTQFTTDKVWWTLPSHYRKVIREPRGLGPVMVKAQSLGYIVALNKWSRSSRGVNHGRPLRRWQSLLFTIPNE